ncbi:MAG: LamG domain-containing protein, partial [Candidatus ainarchaeum sp.]|nr:LamG domain-containing protein [Candidatus ainarchaeum sp.]
IDESLLASSVDVNKCHYGDVLYPDMNDCNFVLCASRIECQTPPIEDDEVEVVTTDVTAPVLSITSSVVDGNSIRVYFTATDNNAIETFDRNYTGSTTFAEFTPVTVTTNNYYLDLNLSYSTDYNFCIKAIDYNSNYTVDCDTNTTDDAPVSQTVLALRNGLVGYWPLDVNAGDYSGNGNNGTVSGATLIDGNVNGAYSFNGSGNYIRLPDSDLFNFGTGDFSIAFWFKNTGTTGLFPAIVSSVGGWSSGAVGLRHNNTTYSNKLSFHFYPADPLLNSVTTYTNNLWHHAVLTRNGTQFTLYMNGESKSTATSSTSFDLANGGGVYFGYGFDGSNSYWKGAIDEVIFWNRDLNSTEISWLYNSGNGLSLRTE